MAVQSSFVFSTRDLPRNEQFAAWRSFMSPVLEVELLDGAFAGFAAEETIWNLGSFAFTREILPAGHKRRFWHRKKDPLDHWYLVLSEAWPPAKGGTARRGSRSLSLRSLAAPYEQVDQNSHVLSLFIPRDLLGGAAIKLDSRRGEIGTTAVGGILTDYLLSLEQRLPQIGVDEFALVADVTRSLITSCLARTADNAVEAQPIISLTVMERARKAILSNLGSPHFGPAQLCRMVAVSRSSLYRLFEPLGGVTHYIQRQRLLHAHEKLSEANNIVAINKVGEEFGFFDASGFSRAFRKEFGYSPSDARAAALAGFPRSPGAPRRFRAPLSHASPLEDVLRSIQA